MSRTIIRMANLGQEIQDIPFLLAQGKDRCQNAFNKEAALVALGRVILKWHRCRSPVFVRL
jgi:hypothetical protein